jgi:hypothetical protein
MTELDVDFSCPVCSERKVVLPDGYSDESTTVCKNCGAQLGAWGSIKDASGKLLSPKAEQALDEAVRDLGEGNKR